MMVLYSAGSSGFSPNRSSHSVLQVLVCLATMILQVQEEPVMLAEN